MEDFGCVPIERPSVILDGRWYKSWRPAEETADGGKWVVARDADDTAARRWIES